MIRCFYRSANAGNLTWGGHCGCKKWYQVVAVGSTPKRTAVRESSLSPSGSLVHARARSDPKRCLAFLDITLQDGETLWLQKVVSVVVTAHLQTQSKRTAAREPSLPRRHWPTRACSDPKRCFGDYSRPSAKWTLALVSIPLTFKLV